MCDTCGCNITPGNEHLIVNDGKLSKTSSGGEAVEVLQGLLHENDHQAMHNRQHFDQHQLLAIKKKNTKAIKQERQIKLKKQKHKKKNR